MGLAIYAQRFVKVANLSMTMSQERTRVHLGQDRYIELRGKMTFMDLFEELDQNEAAGNEEAGEMNQAAACFELRRGQIRRTISLLFDQSCDSKHDLFHAIMLLSTCLDTYEYNSIWIKVPSVALFPLEYLKQCLLEGKNYVLELSEVAQHPQAMSVYRSASYKQLHLIGGLAPAEDAYELPVFDEHSQGEGPEILILGVKSDVHKAIGCFSGCTKPKTLTVEDGPLNAASADQQHVFFESIPLLPKVSTVKIAVHGLAPESRQYWTDRNCTLLLNHQQITKVDVAFDEQILDDFGNGIGERPDRLRLTNILARSIQGNTSIVSFSMDIELVSVWQWDTRIAPVLRRNGLRQAARTAKANMNGTQFREWLFVQMTVYGEVDLRHLLVQEFLVES